MPLIIPSNSISAGGYEVDNSLRFDDGSSDYLNRTPSAGNRDKWTLSMWFKLSDVSSRQTLFTAYSDASNFTVLNFESSRTLNFYDYASGINGQRETTQLFRDVSAWYHLVIIWDRSNATTEDKIIIYVNDTRVTAFNANSAPSNQSIMNSTAPVRFGTYATNYYFDGYMSEVCLIDGQALDPTSFGEFDEDSGIWKPIDVSGLTFGTNGFYLPFENSGALGQDDSGNGNNFTVNNLTSIDQTTDTPTNNFATMNFLDQNGGPTFSGGNLNVGSTSPSWRSTEGTFGVTQGKWFYEVQAAFAGGSLLDMMVGWGDFEILTPSEFSSSNPALTYTAGSGNKQLNGANTSYGATYNVGDIIGVAFDADALTVEFYKNGTSQGTITTGWSSGITWTPIVSLYGRYSNTKASFNFGSSANFTISSGNADDNGYGNFEYAVPSGYYSLCTKNLAEFG